MSQRELARTLKLSPGTVNHHLRSLGSCVVVSRSPVRIDSDALERIAGAEQAPTPPRVGTRSSTGQVRAAASPIGARTGEPSPSARGDASSLGLGAFDLRSAAAIAQELCDTLTHAAVLAEQLAQMGFDVPGVARTDRAILRDEPREGPRDTDRAASRGTNASTHTGTGGESPASGHDSQSQPDGDGARWPRDEVRDVAQSLARQEHPRSEHVSPGQPDVSGFETVREPRDAARGSSFEERKKDLLSSPSSEEEGRAKESRGSRTTTSRTAVSSRTEVRAALEPLIEQCRRSSKPYSIDANGISILQSVPVENLEHAVQQICRQIRTDPQNNVRTPIGLLVAKAQQDDEIFTITEQAAPTPTAPPPEMARRVEDEITLDDLWSKLTADQRASIDSQVTASRHSGPMMVVGQKRMLAAEILGIDLDDSSAA